MTFKGEANSVTPRPSVWISVLIFALATGFMAWLRLYVFWDRFIALTYGLPLLLCLWHRDRVLLWSMVAAFLAISAGKAFLVLPVVRPDDFSRLTHWLMQVTNMVVIGLTVHIIIRYTNRLRERNAELAAQKEEIARQNDELQAQSEELAQQNEEIQQQTEELSRQNEELQQQGELLANQNEELRNQARELQSTSQELQVANTELHHREGMLERILTSLGEVKGEREIIDRICQTLLGLMGDSAAGAVVAERAANELVVHAHAGGGQPTGQRWPLAGSFAALVIERNQTAFVDDLAARPDIRVIQPDKETWRSVIGTPLRIGNQIMGVVSVYSRQPQNWTTQHFRIIEWVATQCAVALSAVRLHEALRVAFKQKAEATEQLEAARDALARNNVDLERLVQERTGKLREMVEELEHFSYTITHDMRAPLRAMQGFAGILTELCGDCMNNDKMECLSRITTSAHRMDRLITDALSYGKTLRQEVQLEVVDTEALLKGILSTYPDFQPPKTDIRVKGALPAVLGNEAALTQCFSNLLSNAVKFVGPGTTPRINIWAEAVAQPPASSLQDGATRPGQVEGLSQRGTANHSVRFWFEDNGIGIPVQAQQKIFQMFQRATTGYDGTGVGLALVRKVVERMGGRVGVESEPGKGSRFWLELKMADGKVQAV
jgi:signal transduction histidine kinase